MSLRDTDEVVVSAEAIHYIETVETREGALAKYEIIEHFFEWLRSQPESYQIKFLKEALSG